MTEINTADMEWPRTSERVRTISQKIAANHGLKVATVLLTAEWPTRAERRRWKAEQEKLIEAVARNYADDGTLKKHAAKLMVKAYRKAVDAKLKAPDKEFAITAIAQPMEAFH